MNLAKFAMREFTVRLPLLQAQYRLAMILMLLIQCGGTAYVTRQTWEEETAGKEVFVMFMSPNCPRCKTVLPSWDELSRDYVNAKLTAVVKVNCNGDGRDLCVDAEVDQFPALKYGIPRDMFMLSEYEGKQDYSSLSKFARQHLPTCGPTNLDACHDHENKLVQRYMNMYEGDLQDEIELIGGELRQKADVLESKQKVLDTEKDKFTEEWKQVTQNMVTASRQTTNAPTQESVEAKRKAKAERFARATAFKDRQTQLDAEKASVRAEVTNSGIKLMQLVYFHLYHLEANVQHKDDRKMKKSLEKDSSRVIPGSKSGTTVNQLVDALTEQAEESDDPGAYAQMISQLQDMFGGRGKAEL